MFLEKPDEKDLKEITLDDFVEKMQKIINHNEKKDNMPIEMSFPIPDPLVGHLHEQVKHYNWLYEEQKAITKEYKELVYELRRKLQSDFEKEEY